MFHDGDLQSGIALAVQQSKAVLCFVQDETETSLQWERILKNTPIQHAISSQAIALRLQAGSQEASYLAPICAINSTPAVLVIRNAQLQENLQSAEISLEELKTRLIAAFGVQDDALNMNVAEPISTASGQTAQPALEYLDLQPTPGQMRLPNNAYDALRNYTQKLLDDGVPPSQIFQTQLTLISHIPIFNEEIERLRHASPPVLSEFARSRLLKLPAVGLRIPGQGKSSPESTAQSSRQETSSRPAPTAQRTDASVPVPVPSSETSSPTPSPGQPSSDKQRAQRAEFIKMQREREQRQRDERERIKAQIKADREERRRLDEMRKQNDLDQNADHVSTSQPSTPPKGKARSAEIRVQVRTFDGSTLRETFKPTSTLSRDIRPWIDSVSNTNVPYNLKLILTPLPNRNIGAGEEEQELADLDIVGSCTLVMVPVKGYVESYTGSTPSGFLGAAVSGGYNLITGTAGALFGGVRSLLGYNQPETQQSSEAQGHTLRAGNMNNALPRSTPNTMHVRTLADQRAEAAKEQEQKPNFYNGNQLNFEPKRDKDDFENHGSD